MIRKADLEDCENILDLSMELSHIKSDRIGAIKRISNIIESDTDCLILYEEDNSILGWIHYYISNRVTTSFLEIGGLVVTKKHRRRGIGKKLVNYAIKFANENNLQARVRCNSKRKDSHCFYKRLGFNHTKSQEIFDILI